MTLNQKKAFVIWAVLALQICFTHYYPKPYPSFGLPGFELNERRIERFNKSFKRKEPAALRELAIITANDSIIFLSHSSILEHVSQYHQKYLFEKLQRRSESLLSRNNHSFLKYNLYSDYFAPNNESVTEIKDLIEAEIKVTPSHLVLIELVNKQINHIDTIEVF